ncbi:hypothetical protein [Pseudonocardia sp. GCM10023141]|uniref:hypothetical protein n=1 Tax=Pseudonocardia sp. GCM10023141 TaxID=3252653 RepID=UPI00361BCA09
MMVSVPVVVVTPDVGPLPAVPITRRTGSVPSLLRVLARLVRRTVERGTGA